MRNIPTDKKLRKLVKNELCSIKRSIKKINAELENGSDGDIDKVKDDILRFKEFKLTSVKYSYHSALMKDFVFTSGLDENQCLFDESVITYTQCNRNKNEEIILSYSDLPTWSNLNSANDNEYMQLRLAVQGDIIYELNGKPYVLKPLENCQDIELYPSLNNNLDASLNYIDSNYTYENDFFDINDWLRVSSISPYYGSTTLYIKKNDTGKIRKQSVLMRLCGVYNPILPLSPYGKVFEYQLLALDKTEMISEDLEIEITITQLP